jgi:hypothetical protein
MFPGLTLFLAIATPNAADAACRLFIPQKEFNHSGYHFRFDFGPLLESKQYTEVETREEADAVLAIRGEEFAGRFFHHALGTIELGETRAVGDRRCLTQLCGIRDFAKAFNDAYRELLKKAPSCGAF